MTSRKTLDALARFARLFNARRFFEAHEALEAVWISTRDPFLKGLIHIAVSFHHHQKGNRHGTLAKLRSGIALLERHPAPTPAWSREVHRLLPRLIAVLSRVEMKREVRRLPKIHAL